MNWKVILSCGVLFSLATATLIYKIVFLSLPILPEKNPREWQIEARISVTSSGKPVRLRLQVPRSDTSQKIVTENFISDGFSLAAVSVDQRREVVWSHNSLPAGDYRLVYHAQVELNENETPPIVRLPPERPGFELSAQKRKELLSRYDTSGKSEAEVKELIERLHREINSSLANSSNKSGQWRQLHASLGALGIQARTSHGLLLESTSRRLPLQHWIEVFIDGNWHTYNLEASSWGRPDSSLIWWRGQTSQIEVEGAENYQITLSTTPVQKSGIALAMKEINSPFTFEAFSIESQAVFRLLMLLPVGGLIIAFFRSVIGLRTFGTFMPVLIALSFRETGFWFGVAIFSSVVVVGLFGRKFLEGMKLLVVPRLAATLTLVIVILIALAIVLESFGILLAVSISLFPMVILTMTIERMAIIIEELGTIEAIIQGLNSLVAASLVYLVISNPNVEYMFFTFPELLLFVLAALILLGRYTGYRLSELFRFRSFGSLTSGK